MAFEWQNYHLYEFSFKENSVSITKDADAVEEWEFLQSKEGIELRKSMDIIPFGYSGFKKSLFAKDM